MARLLWKQSPYTPRYSANKTYPQATIVAILDQSFTFEQMSKELDDSIIRSMTPQVTSNCKGKYDKQDRCSATHIQLLCEVASKSALYQKPFKVAKKISLAFTCLQIWDRNQTGSSGGWKSITTPDNETLVGDISPWTIVLFIRT